MHTSDSPGLGDWTMAAFQQSADDDRRSVTDLLLEVRRGNPEAMDRLFSLVYPQLRRIARRQLQGERPGHTLGTTGLVHETYLKLVDQSRIDWQDRGHFFAMAARAMRQILVDYARRYRTQRRGGGLQRVALTDRLAVDEQAELVLAVHEALGRLAGVSERLSRVVECRYFAGLTEEETAVALGVTARTVERDWVKAKGWLYQELRN
jgi:RNA polymerase sigma factor (TIGR02999 family)